MRFMNTVWERGGCTALNKRNRNIKIISQFDWLTVSLFTSARPISGRVASDIFLIPKFLSLFLWNICVNFVVFTALIPLYKEYSYFLLSLSMLCEKS